MKITKRQLRRIIKEALLTEKATPDEIMFKVNFVMNDRLFLDGEEPYVMPDEKVVVSREEIEEEGIEFADDAARFYASIEYDGGRYMDVEINSAEEARVNDWINSIYGNAESTGSSVSPTRHDAGVALINDRIDSMGDESMKAEFSQRMMLSNAQLEEAMADAWESILSKNGYNSKDGKQLIRIPGKNWKSFYTLLFTEFINSSPRPVSSLALKGYKLNNIPISEEELSISVGGGPEGSARTAVVKQFESEGKVWRGIDKLK